MRWPLWFELEPVEEDFAEQAWVRLELEAEIAAPPAWVLDTFAEQGARFTPLAAEVFELGERLYDYFYFGSFCHRVLDRQAGRRWVARTESTSLPVLRAMLQIAELEPGPDGGARFRWSIYYDPRGWAKPLDPLVRPVFELWLKATLRGLQRLCERELVGASASA